ESLNSGDASEIQQEDQSASEITQTCDTFAKALNTTDSSAPPSMAGGIDTSGGGNIYVIIRDQSTLIIQYLNLYYLCKSTFCLLFLSMQWASQSAAEDIQEDKLSGKQIKQVMEHIWKLQELCKSVAKLGIEDIYESAYLKAIVFFTPHHPGLASTSQILKFQERHRWSYRIIFRKPTQKTPTDWLMSSNITKELVFTDLIGNVSIDSIIPYLLKKKMAEYNGQNTDAKL
ncbi:hypothetical protein E2I00_018922, partial [Balaenoptera physalus]